MRVVLQVTTGPGSGRKLPVQPREVVRVGRSEAADVCFQQDVTMFDIHFEIETQDDLCLLRDLVGGGTFVNNQAVNGEAALTDGDVILAGETSLLVSIEGVSRESDPDETGGDKLGLDPAGEPQTAASFRDLPNLEAHSLALLVDDQTPLAFVDTLVEHRQFADAIRVLSLLLPKRESVWWAYQCVDEMVSERVAEAQRLVMDVTSTWFKEPTDANRRAAMAAGEATRFETPHGWVALAAFWSEGSMTAVELPEALPGEKLTARAVTAALLMTASLGEPDQTEQRYRRILDIGREILDGRLPVPA